MGRIFYFPNGLLSGHIYRKCRIAKTFLWVCWGIEQISMAYLRNKPNNILIHSYYEMVAIYRISRFVRTRYCIRNCGYRYMPASEAGLQNLLYIGRPRFRLKAFLYGILSWPFAVINQQKPPSQRKMPCARLREGRQMETNIYMCMRPANERRCYIVTSSSIGCTQTLNDPWYWTFHDQTPNNG